MDAKRFVILIVLFAVSLGLVLSESTPTVDGADACPPVNRFSHGSDGCMEFRGNWTYEEITVLKSAAILADLEFQIVRPTAKCPGGMCDYYEYGGEGFWIRVGQWDALKHSLCTNFPGELDLLCKSPEKQSDLLDA